MYCGQGLLHAAVVPCVLLLGPGCLRRGAIDDDPAPAVELVLRNEALVKEPLEALKRGPYAAVTWWRGNHRFLPLLP